MKSAVKRELRARLLILRNGLSASYRRRAGKAISARVLGLPQWRKARTVALYARLGSEVDTRELIRRAIKEGKTVVLPKVDLKRGSMDFHEAGRGLADCRTGVFGIPEPSARSKKVRNKSIDLAVVPGIAFDRARFRLGYGKGFYDRFLSKNRVYSIGLSYQKTLLSRLPREAHDARLRRVVTEIGIIR